MNHTGPGIKSKALAALVLLVPFPTLGVMAAMYLPATRGTVPGQAFYFLSKMWILLLPLVWLIWVEKKPLHLSRPKLDGMGFAILTGLFIALLMYAVFRWFGADWIDLAFLREQARKNGLGKPLRYIALACFLTFFNALLEEYVWRWFAFRQCKVLMGSLPAMFATALFFTLHHVFALHAQFDWRVTFLGSLGVFTGSLIWSWCCRRYGSIWPGYVNHVILDAAIFLIGWRLIFGQG